MPTDCWGRGGSSPLLHTSARRLARFVAVRECDPGECVGVGVFWFGERHRSALHN
jgi:hypothetical protein